MSRKLFVLAAAFALQAPSANAFHSGEHSAGDFGKSGIWRQRTSYCEDSLYRCRQKVGPWSTHFPSQNNQCEVSYDQCMRR